MILGNQEAIDRAKKADPGDKSNHVNWDAIDALPEEYEAVITEVKYKPTDLKASFSDVGNDTWMPKPELMYEIAEACGIVGGDNSVTEAMVEEVDWNRIKARIGEAPNMVRAKVGARVRKYSSVMQEDGTFRKSDVCTSEYNVYERCCELWSKEEADTNGYTVEIKDGEYTAFDKKFYGPHYYKGKYAYGLKYRTQYQRQAHFDAEMKFAHAKAETKAHLKTIRVLAGLMTGYKKEDLTSGVLIFMKIRRSRAVLKMETGARLAAMSRGEIGSTPQVALFGATAAPQDTQPPEQGPNVEDAVSERVDDDSPFGAPQPPVEKKDPREEYIAVLNNYYPKKIADTKQGKAKTILDWASKNKECTGHKDWPQAIAFLKEIESELPDEFRIDHKLY
jgi:hypothetical protein